MEYTWDGSTLTMLGVGSKDEILGMVDNKNMWESRYGDWAVTIQPLTDKLLHLLLRLPKNSTRLLARVKHLHALSRLQSTVTTFT